MRMSLVSRFRIVTVVIAAALSACGGAYEDDGTEWEEPVGQAEAGISSVAQTAINCKSSPVPVVTVR